MARRNDTAGDGSVTHGSRRARSVRSGGKPGARPERGGAKTAKVAKDRKKARTTGRAAAAAEPVDPVRAREFGRRLRAWYRANARDLPWRRTSDPYHVLVSELMLQQTQVARVVDFYATFLGRFPTIRHVAEAAVHEVTAAWEGLGYYARARNLHALARRVTAERTDATLPSTPEALRALPGIGAYTAGAVASFAYRRRAALVDTNVARVLERVFAPGTPVKTTAGAKRVWAIAASILPRTGRDTWTHNQALMELGALVCTARVRRCEACPVRTVCLTHEARGCPADVPSLGTTSAVVALTRGAVRGAARSRRRA